MYSVYLFSHHHHHHHSSSTSSTFVCFLYIHPSNRYLEQRDPEMHSRAKTQIKECYEKNKIGDPMYRSLTTSMNARLRATVGDVYWKKAQDYLDHFVRQKSEKKHGSISSGSGSMSTTTATTATFPPPLPGVSGGGSGAPAPPPPAIVPTGLPQTTANPLLPNAAAPAAILPSAAKEGKGKVSRPAKTKEEKNKLARENRAKKKLKEAAAKAAAAAAASGTARALLPTGVGIAHSTTASAAATTSTTNTMTTPGYVPSSSTSGVRLVSAKVAAAAAAAGTLASSQLPVITAAPATTPTTTTSTNVSTSSTSSPTPPNSKAKDKKVESGGSKSVKRKSLTKSTSSSSITKKKQQQQQEPSNVLMESIDHATMLDVKRLPNIFTSREYKFDVNINEEQKILLYGEDKEHQRKMKEITDASIMALETEVDSMDAKFKEAGVPPLPSKIPTMYNGWGERNIFSVRNAWAKVRLPESDMRRAELEREASDEKTYPSSRPTTILEAEECEERSSGSSSPSSAVDVEDVFTIKNDTTNHVWYNESRAEQDLTLALLSTATEQYMKSVIEAALGKARLRQNLDGVRLWHTLEAHHHAAVATTTSSSTKNAPEDPPFPPPPALIRLGCDVRRQIALSEGNAAKVYQRMEEALSRRNGNQSNDIDERMLLESTSMADYSKKAPLKYAVQQAEVDAKRKFAVFSGVDSMDPPLGRVPKEARVTLRDLAVSALGSRASTIGLRRKRCRAGLNF